MTDLPAAGPTESRTDARRGSVVLAATGVLFALYPVVRPYPDESTVRGAEAMASTAWVASHLFAMIGFIVLQLGLMGLHGLLSSPAARRAARGAVVVTWLGAGLALPYYGAETFALNTVGRQVAQGGDPTLLGLAAAIRFGPTQAVMFAAGLLLLALGTVLVAVAIWRSGTLPRWSGVPLAVGFGLLKRSRRAGLVRATASGKPPRTTRSAYSAWLTWLVWHGGPPSPNTASTNASDPPSISPWRRARARSSRSGPAACPAAPAGRAPALTR